MGVGMGGHHSPASETVVWLTPPDILSALGDFDLDPCACSEPRPWPTARTHFTVEDDGLTKPWFGRVWMNPPYGPPKVVGPWMRRMADHGAGTALIFARTETALFFETVWRRAAACLFLEGRLFFCRPDGTQAGHNAGAPSVLVAYGEYDAKGLRHSGLPGHFVRLSDPSTEAA
jgi:hypothetical protein